MHHDEHIRQHGSCPCGCHNGSSKCDCMLSYKVRLRFNPPVKTRQPGHTKLTSRVLPFAKSRRNVMKVTEQHGYHELRRAAFRDPYDSAR